jgi:D-methionine transport system ATP-binding protein
LHQGKLLEVVEVRNNQIFAESEIGRELVQED